MKRYAIQTIVVLVLSIFISPLSVDAQQSKKIPRIGFLDGSTKNAIYFKGFREGLRWIGYVEGKTILLETRFAQGKLGRLPAFAKELVDKKVDIIVTVGGAAVAAAQRATKTIPIVMGFSGDPVAAGIVESYVRPGHNVTGLSFFSSKLAGKRLEFLKTVVPGITRVAVLTNPGHPGEQIDWHEAQAAAKKLGLALDYVPVRNPGDFKAAFARMTRSRPDGLLVIPDGLTVVHRRQIAAFAIKQRLPMIAGWTAYTKAGGLMSYGPSIGRGFSRVAFLMDKVLKGANPAQVPVESPLKFKLVLNLATAKAIGLTIPSTVLFQADEVIR